MTEDSREQNTATAGRRARGRRLLRRQSVAQAAVLLSALTLLSKFIGFARDAIVAHNWGATGVTDAFLIGMMVPSVLLGIVSTGLSTIVVPWYISNRKDDPDDIKRLGNLYTVRIIVRWGDRRRGNGPSPDRLRRRARRARTAE